MARENFVLFHGQVADAPTIHINNDGEPIFAMFPLKVLRRPTNSQGFDSKIYVDMPIIRTRNLQIINLIKNIRQFDMIDIRGVLSSKEVIKKSRCPNCEHINASDGNIVYVTPIYLCRRETGLNEKQGLDYLKERNEVSNLVNIIGTVCQEPQFYTDLNGRNYAQYQIACNRRYHIHEDPDEVKTDYPWIKTFGTQALKDAECLQVSSNVYISGAIQTREITKTVICEECGCEYEKIQPVAEIVPYYTGYLSNCIVPEKKAEDDCDD